jgi:spermidine synthase
MTMSESPREDWFAEPPFAGYRQQYRVLKRIEAFQTDFQSLEIVELESYGRTLLLDGTGQTSVGEEFTYHEHLVHVPMFAHPRPRRVLVIGGGDGGTLRHALLHPTVERALEVELDKGVVDASLRHLPEISGGAYDDSRAELIIGDGVAYLRDSGEQFDVILIDSTDPVGPAAALISEDFLETARRALTPGGLVAMQSGSPVTQPREWLSTVGAFKNVFPVVKPYIGNVYIYPGVQWSWVTGSNEVDAAVIDDITVGTRLDSLREPLRIYNPAVHRAAFALPNYMQRLLDHHGPLTREALQAAGHPLPGVVD